MGSFQQIVMGMTCLAAAFFFGSYLHNRPADNQKITDNQVVLADPMDSILAFGKKPAGANTANNGNAQPAYTATQPATQNQSIAQLPSSPARPAIDPSELAPGAVQRSIDAQQSSVVPAAARKPVVPDFSELASRFRNTPLELNQPSKVEANSSVHEAERVPWSGVFKAPEMVIRQPENVQPLQDLKSAVDQVEETIHNEFASSSPQPTRWRVNRSDKIDQFVDQIDNRGQFEGRPQVQTTFQQAPSQDFGPRETIDDVLSRRSADWLKQDQPAKQTWATDPPQTGWMSEQRRDVTRKAAMRNQATRNQDILEIEDPGNRFKSFVNDVEEISRPQPDFDSDYYTPTSQRQDSMAPPQPMTRLQPIRSDNNSDNSENWGRRSNIRSSGNNQTQASNRYTGQRGDTLQTISVKFFGTPAHYLEIYKANRVALDGISSSLEGVVLKIPNVNN